LIVQEVSLWYFRHVYIMLLIKSTPFSCITYSISITMLL
jgi:hypothetical protein